MVRWVREGHLRVTGILWTRNHISLRAEGCEPITASNLGIGKGCWRGSVGQQIHWTILALGFCGVRWLDAAVPRMPDQLWPDLPEAYGLPCCPHAVRYLLR